MIKNGYYYPDWIWKNKIHKNEETGNYEGTTVYNFIMGNRRAGKTVGTGIYILNDFFKYGYKCALIRRNIKEFENSKTSTKAFWDKCWKYCDLAKEHKITYKEHKAYIDDVLFCYPLALSDIDNIKNESFDNVHTLIFDEFIKESKRELKINGMNEFTALLSIYDTVTRNREDALLTTSIVFIANSVTKRNIYFEELGIIKELRNDTKRLLREEKGYCIEIVNNYCVTDEIVNSPFFKILKNTKSGRDYFGYSQDNRFKDNTDFVKKISDDKKRYLYTFIYENKKYSLVFCKNKNVWYFSDSYDETFPHIIALTKEDHSINSTLINYTYKKELKTLKNIYENGDLYFQDLNCKKIWENIYSFL